jgi:hypothetical protein
MAQNITLLGASYSDVPSVELPKTGGGTAQFDDTTIASNAASASDITSGKLAFVNGELVTGTASGGGATLITKSITANGTYNASSDNADGYSSVTVNVSGGGGGGLVYETGFVTLSADASTLLINFADTHTVAPFYYMICDDSNQYQSMQINLFAAYYNYHQMFGNALTTNGKSYEYGMYHCGYRNAAGASTITRIALPLTTPYTNSADSITNNSRYWATETQIKGYANSTNRYWRSGHTYKWVAVWVPTS